MFQTRPRVRRSVRLSPLMAASSLPLQFLWGPGQPDLLPGEPGQHGDWGHPQLLPHLPPLTARDQQLLQQQSPLPLLWVLAWLWSQLQQWRDVWLLCSSQHCCSPSSLSQTWQCSWRWSSPLLCHKLQSKCRDKCTHQRRFWTDSGDNFFLCYKYLFEKYMNCLGHKRELHCPSLHRHK